MPTYQWVDLMKYDEARDGFVHLVRIILEKGKIRFKGNETIIRKLQDGIELPSHRKMTPHDGRRFLEAIAKQFNSPYLLASGINEGETLTSFSSPEPSSYETT